jgi:hypothetical protein
MKTKITSRSGNLVDLLGSRSGVDKLGTKNLVPELASNTETALEVGKVMLKMVLLELFVV